MAKVLIKWFWEEKHAFYADIMQEIHQGVVLDLEKAALRADREKDPNRARRYQGDAKRKTGMINSMSSSVALNKPRATHDSPHSSSDEGSYFSPLEDLSPGEEEEFNKTLKMELPKTAENKAREIIERIKAKRSQRPNASMQLDPSDDNDVDMSSASAATSNPAKLQDTKPQTGSAKPGRKSSDDLVLSDNLASPATAFNSSTSSSSSSASPGNRKTVAPVPEKSDTLSKDKKKPAKNKRTSIAAKPARDDEDVISEEDISAASASHAKPSASSSLAAQQPKRNKTKKKSNTPSSHDTSISMQLDSSDGNDVNMSSASAAATDPEKSKATKRKRGSAKPGRKSSNDLDLSDNSDSPATAIHPSVSASPSSASSESNRITESTSDTEGEIINERDNLPKSKRARVAEKPASDDEDVVSEEEISADSASRAKPSASSSLAAQHPKSDTPKQRDAAARDLPGFHAHKAQTGSFANILTPGKTEALANVTDHQSEITSMDTSDDTAASAIPKKTLKEKNGNKK